MCGTRDDPSAGAASGADTGINRDTSNTIMHASTLGASNGVSSGRASHITGTVINIDGGASSR